ncbi:hypothetical protein [Nonomuraea turcica]|uniref:hypothetical protein n=1 Tax=Nonomuraea sp. G32 TaxID=3067274 RepID=UPI00273A9403|nr:hypothetical protein [Nonomuraea sp. G32]MDP4511536.1 hypothetical protein [Nonomuraea sp. G32]
MSIKRKRFGKLMATLLTTVSSLILMISTPTAGQASSASSWTTQKLKEFGASAFTFGGVNKAGTAIACVGKADAPHWSSGADSVIYKTRVACNATVIVRIDGALMYVAGGSLGKPASGPGQRVAESAQSQWVSAGSPRTYYTPKQDSGVHIRKSGTYYGVSRGQIIDSCCSYLDGTASSRVYVAVKK